MDAAQAAIAEAAGTIGSRFESQKTVDEARERKDREWKDAYAKIGQEPPPKSEEPVHDGRTLYERLQINKEAKNQEWDAKMKLSNQYRGLDTEEQKFLSDKAAERRAEEKKRQDAENAEVMEYRERLAARNATELSAPEYQPQPSSSKSSSSNPRIPPKPAKKDVKSLMKGVVVKKKPKVVSTTKAGDKPSEEKSQESAGVEPAAWLDGTKGKRKVESEEASDHDPGKKTKV
ncbi:N-terminal domain of NEFA-interacting nuclear protein NIP30-domain-containing protein [Kockovaella imperatae]|uniref:N-terminal domain of NEFA-interacting nuclear protein NIP30-domain-containing protein n=1 Tax=Kockovaella imperatae TaxID=4999 RepID=A0A1Y1UNE2_9TREE|nr:N-terminal domain of NEFA-interacting nuclear protein NIP30-domain-containing protein [Kockovaella imperatae]ORX39037.1 N-terminal domain of NEFA-interacting nuclear protein NIP30-domain-containing protein [Kockovaella imperatae]